MSSAPPPLVHPRRVRPAWWVAFGVALVVVVVAGAVVGQRLRDRHLGPDPVPTVRRATAAFAGGDCAALRAVADRPSSVTCGQVTQVAAAYRREHLDPSSFSYAVVARGRTTSTVQITYRESGVVRHDRVSLVLQQGHWRVTGLGALGAE